MDDSAAKKSAWLARRSKVIQEGSEYGEIEVILIPESKMVADANTKYLIHSVWDKHMVFKLNPDGMEGCCW